MVPDSFTLGSVIKASLGDNCLNKAIQIHGLIIQLGFDSNDILTGSLIDAYAKCGSVRNGCDIYKSMQKKDIVSCTALIAGYAREGSNCCVALNLFNELRRAQMKIDDVLLCSMLNICANTASLGLGRQIHAIAVKCEPNKDMAMGNVLIDMYSKAGGIEDANRIFDEMEQKNVISWTSLIAGYGKHGDGNKAIGLYKKMEYEGFVPNDVTFLSLLFACSHNGLIAEGWECFNSMVRRYNISPRSEHYTCMVDLFARGGRLEEAYNLICKMTVKPNASLWGAILGGCSIYGNTSLGEVAARHLFDIEPENSVNYVVLASIYAAAGLWDNARKIRKLDITFRIAMEFNDDQTERISRRVPYFGAIFMSNRRTKNECFDRRIFGLPYALANFVKDIKAGMRKLYGVFEAISDGAINVVPHAYHSSGKFPAQVQFGIIWKCYPLSEADFHDAIKDNYYSANKFHLGLSKEQVHRLLWLFNSKKVGVHRSLRNQKIEKSLCTSDTVNPLAHSGNCDLERNDSVAEKQTRFLSGVSHSLNAGTSNIFAICTSSNSFTSGNVVASHSIGSVESVSGSQSIPLLKETEHVDVSANGPSLETEDYIPLCSPEGSYSREAPGDKITKVKCLYSDNPNKKVDVFSRVNKILKASAQGSKGNSDIPMRRTGVFSCMDFISESVMQEKERSFRVDKSVQTIMENLQQRHDNWRKTMKNLESEVNKAGHRSVDKRASVFSRLAFPSEAFLQEREIPVDDNELMKEKSVRKVFLRDYANHQNGDMTIKVKMIDDESGTERMEKQTLNFRSEGKLSKTMCEAEGRDCKCGMVKVSSPDAEHKKRRRMCSWSRNE
ncbi:hypothetical protein RJ640_005051 [Escallonia rubra]|uniref:DCD domain-containing protein n=1 Tax=Escallonia rubra TaxID=112253 RepID=A0AA88U7X9_9ASTE|nr:hypothetical protein RJ640_005051 [Escallonia rubra]